MRLFKIGRTLLSSQALWGTGIFLRRVRGALFMLMNPSNRRGVISFPDNHQPVLMYLGYRPSLPPFPPSL